jgi:hypothetical protein
MTYPPPPEPLPQRTGKQVHFSPPQSVEEGASRTGDVIDSVQSGPHRDDEWGYYLYFSELIRWKDNTTSVRLAYYYAPFGANRWLWGGQYSIEDTPAVIKDLIEKTLQKKDWFTQRA